MKVIQIFKIAVLATVVLFSSCSKDEDTNPNETGNPVIDDQVTAENITYEASGGFTYTDAATSTAKSYTHLFVKAQYKDVSHIWQDTHYTYLAFYNTNATAAAEMITFVFLGKQFPKTGTYTIGPAGAIAMSGISASDKLLVNEVGIMVVGNGKITKRDASVSLNITNDNGKIIIKNNGDINVYDNLTGELEGSCKNINLTRTTKKM